MSGRESGGWYASAGFTGVDVAIAFGIAAMTAALAMPLAAHALDASRVRHAAVYLAAELRAARQQAVTTRRATALLFDRVGDDWTFRRCRDGNGNGVRRADVNAGVDPCTSAGVRLSSRVRDVRIAVSDGIPGPDDDPSSADAVRFGVSDMASCSPVGGCSTGTVFVRSAGGTHFAVRVGGVTGRTRVLAYDPGTRRWLME